MTESPTPYDGLMATTEFQVPGTLSAPVGPETKPEMHEMKSSGSRTRAVPKRVELSDFEILNKLGSGSMGVVYLAKQKSEDRQVAIKAMFRRYGNDLVHRERFAREIDTMAQLDHPNLIEIYGAGEEKGLPFFAMEYVQGLGLEKWLEQKGGKLSFREARILIVRCADGLMHAHQQAIVHRDIKPDNILVSRQGKVKVTDFSLAKASETDIGLTQTGAGLGTPEYAAPEQFYNAKNVDGRSDIYSLGVLFYQLLTGKLPFPGSSVIDVVRAKEKGKFRAATRHDSTLPSRIDWILTKMLAKEPDQRYASCADLLQDLEELTSLGSPK